MVSLRRENSVEGIHKGGEKIAVKMLHDMPGLEEDQFLNEFNNLARLQHQNIVRIIGYCYETRKEYVNYNGRLLFAERTLRLLCFEYMHHRGLDNYISDEHHGLDWSTRYKIIKEVSMGLKYLHEELETPIYHLDLKPENILLDENMVPKIADFGLSRFFGEETTQITRSFIGTPGYLPPEYIERNIISNKFDVFSLGVVMIKIMAGSASYYKSAEMPPQQFVELVHRNWRNRLQETQLHMLEEYAKQVKKCIEIALSCVEADRCKRPSIGDIVKALNETETLIKRRKELGPSTDQDLNSSWPWLEETPKVIAIGVWALVPILLLEPISWYSWVVVMAMNVVILVKLSLFHDRWPTTGDITKKLNGVEDPSMSRLWLQKTLMFAFGVVAVVMALNPRRSLSWMLTALGLAAGTLRLLSVISEVALDLIPYLRNHYSSRRVILVAIGGIALLILLNSPSFTTGSWVDTIQRWRFFSIPVY